MNKASAARSESGPGSGSSAAGGGRSRRGRSRRRGRRRRKPADPAHREARAESKSDGPLDGPARRLGIDRLYPEQQQVLAQVLDGRHVLMVLPTGFGKSACYQIPSMILPRPVVVVSPLLALLRDQQQKLQRHDVPCVRLDGTVRGRERTAALERIAAGGPLLVMTTPETLEVDDVQRALGTHGVGLAAVDEAHCVSEWGHDFRPSYSRIGARLRQLGGPPVLALTATATPRVRSTIIDSLGMQEPTVVSASPHRSNLAFEVISCRGDQRLRALARLTRRLRRPGIIYCATRRETDAVHALLRRIGIPAYRYHGKMTAAERDVEQSGFMRPRRRSVMVATSAFGLGIDKRDIRYIVHFQAPASLEQYVQEAGRAGRDGRQASCVLLADPSDRSIHESLLARSRVRPDQLYRLGKTLAAWASEGRSPAPRALAVSAELGPRVVAALLAKLEEAGLVVRGKSSIDVTAPADVIEERARGLAGQFETLRTQDVRRLDALAEYVESDHCRATFLSSYFGEEDDGPCGLCDNCRERPERPASFFKPLTQPEPPARPRGRRRRRSGRRKSRQRSSSKSASGRSR